MSTTDDAPKAPAASARRSRRWGAIRRRGDRTGFTVRFHHGGRTFDRSGGTTWAVADKKRRQAHTLLEAGVSVDEVLAQVFGDFHGARLTFREACPHYLAYAGGRKRPSSLADDTYRLAAIARAPWAGKMLSAIRPADFLPWIAERQKSRTVERLRKRRKDETRAQFKVAKDRKVKKTLPGVSAPTLNKDLFLVSALFQWAIKAGYIEGNPARRVEKLPDGHRAREVYLSAAESAALVDAAAPMLRPLLVTALHTGMRRGELLDLEWGNVDLDRREITVKPESEKVGRGRVVPMTADLHTMLVALRMARCPSLHGADPVFTRADGSPLGRPLARSSWTTALAACDAIPLAKRAKVNFHSLRHTCASLMVAAGVPLFDVAKILGHSTLAVTMRYAHFAPEAGRTAVDRLGAVAASGVTYIPPVVALGIGAWLAGEPVRASDIVAMAAILLGVGVLQSGRKIANTSPE